jgi:hypothetical protein
MKVNKIRKKDKTKFETADNSIKIKDRIVNSIVFTVVFCIAIFIISRIV